MHLPATVSQSRRGWFGSSGRVLWQPAAVDAASAFAGTAPPIPGAFKLSSSAPTSKPASAGGRPLPEPEQNSGVRLPDAELASRTAATVLMPASKLSTGTEAQSSRYWRCPVKRVDWLAPDGAAVGLSRGSWNPADFIHVVPPASVKWWAFILPSKPWAMYPMDTSGSDQEMLSGSHAIRASQNHADMYTAGPAQFAASRMTVQ